MPVKPIQRYPNKCLTTLCEEITVFDEKTKELEQDLLDTVKAHKADGLAANQIGELHRALVINTYLSDVPESEPTYLVMFNPVLKNFGGSLVRDKEGCLSFPGVFEMISRFHHVDVEYQTAEGLVQTIALEAHGAVAFLHERDHLDGVTFLDRMSKLQKSLALNRYAKINKQHKHHLENLADKLGLDLIKLEAAIGR